jgi:hypothetical protein
MNAGRRNSDESPRHGGIRSPGMSLLFMHELFLASIMLLIVRPALNGETECQDILGKE